jgi:hypothetical protein
LGALRGLEDEGLGLGLGVFEVQDVAVEFADVLSDEGVTFSFLQADQVSRGPAAMGASLGRECTCSSGVGWKKRARTACMMAQQAQERSSGRWSRDGGMGGIRVRRVGGEGGEMLEGVA